MVVSKAKLKEIYKRAKDVLEAIDKLDLSDEKTIFMTKEKINGAIKAAANFSPLAVKAINEESKTFNLDVLSLEERDKFSFSLGFLISVSSLVGNIHLYEALKALWISFQP